MGRIRVLLYHRVEDLQDDYNYQAVNIEHFRKQILYLKNYYDIISPEMLDKELNDKKNREQVLITFDDGYYDFYSNAMPILKEYNVPVTLFITTDNIDTCYENWTDNILRIIYDKKQGNNILSICDEKVQGSWSVLHSNEKAQCYQDIRNIFLHSNREERDKYIRLLENWAGISHDGRPNRRILNAKEILDISKEEIITIGSHTCSHPSLRCLSLEEQREEIEESKRKLEQIIDRRIEYFSYPFGTQEQYSVETVELVRNAGYKKAFTVSNEIYGENMNCFEIPRCPVGNYNEKEFENFMKNKMFNF